MNGILKGLGRVNTRRLDLVVMALVVITMALQGCMGNGPQLLDGQVIAVGAGEVARGVRACLGDKPGTIILQSQGRFFLYGWPSVGENYAFTLVDGGKMVFVRDAAAVMGRKGNLANWSTFSDLVKWAKGNGWKESNGLAGPVGLGGLKRTIKWLATRSGNVIYLLIVPVGVFEPYFELDRYWRGVDS